MVEHTPWIGQDYALGIGGQRIAIVGYSHHRKSDEPDHGAFTQAVVRDVIAGNLKGDSFFTPVREYFGYDDKLAFWNRVMFFNFLPDCVGLTHQRYAKGTKDQISRGRERVLRIIQQKDAPHKLLVFTRKGWNSFPRTDEQQSGKELNPLGTDFDLRFSWGTYASGDHSVMAFGLRHPQFYSGRLMRPAVQHVLEMPCPHWA